MSYTWLTLQVVRVLYTCSGSSILNDIILAIETLIFHQYEFWDDPLGRICVSNFSNILLHSNSFYTRTLWLRFKCCLSLNTFYHIPMLHECERFFRLNVLFCEHPLLSFKLKFHRAFWLQGNGLSSEWTYT